MAAYDDDLTCNRCQRSFTQKSSLARHSKRCRPGVKAPTRQKACTYCAKAKVRCDLVRPTCGRCLSRSLVCEFAADANDASDEALSSDGISLSTTSDLFSSLPSSVPATNSFDIDAGLLSAPSTRSVASDGLSHGTEQRSRVSSRNSPRCMHFDPAKLALPEKRRRELLGGATWNANFTSFIEHTAKFVSRTCRSWARLLAVHGIKHLPPMMHRLQFEEGTPSAISNCLTLLRMWEDSHPGSQQLVHDTILAEIKRIIGSFEYDAPEDLLADCQALLMLMIVLFLGFDNNVTRDPGEPSDGDIMLASWCLKEKLAKTGLYLEAEATQTLPAWREWAFTAAKRRTILATHHFEWSWSILSGYPILTCFELGPLPAPEAGYLWSEVDEGTWKSLYESWLGSWKDGGFMMCEFFHIGKEVSLDDRGELWYAEADKFGTMLIVEVNASLELAAMNP